MSNRGLNITKAQMRKWFGLWLGGKSCSSDLNIHPVPWQHGIVTSAVFQGRKSFNFILRIYAKPTGTAPSAFWQCLMDRLRFHDNISLHTKLSANHQSLQLLLASETHVDGRTMRECHCSAAYTVVHVLLSFHYVEKEIKPLNKP